MATLDDISALMRTIGPAADFAAIQEFADEKAWLIAVDEETILGADFDSGRGVLVLSADLGVPHAKVADRIYKLALVYARAWYASEGAYLGLDDETGELKLYSTIAVDGVEAGELGVRIIGFSVKIAGWRKLVAVPASDNQDLLEQMAREVMLRV